MPVLEAANQKPILIIRAAKAAERMDRSVWEMNRDQAQAENVHDEREVGQHHDLLPAADVPADDGLRDPLAVLDLDLPEQGVGTLAGVPKHSVG